MPGSIRGTRSARFGDVRDAVVHEALQILGVDLGEATVAIQSQRAYAARGLARETGAVVVLKGQDTVVADPGGRAAVNPTGNPGMGTAGTGDVLAGVVGALLARHESWLAATAGVYVHGRAGDLAAETRGEAGLLAGDLAESLPRAIESLRRAGGASSGR